MKTEDANRFAELAARLAQMYPAAPALHCAHTAGALMRLAARAQRLAEDQCNRPEKTEGEWERRRASLSKATRAAIDELSPYLPRNARPIGFELSGDPRGYCLRLFNACLPGNTWGGADAGYGV